MNRKPERTLADYLQKGDYFDNESDVTDDFVLAVFTDINQKLDIILQSQAKLLQNPWLAERGDNP